MFADRDIYGVFDIFAETDATVDSVNTTLLVTLDEKTAVGVIVFTGVTVDQLDIIDEADINEEAD